MGFFQILKKWLNIKSLGLLKEQQEEAKDIVIENSWKNLKYKVEIRAQRGVFISIPSILFLDIKFPLIAKNVDRLFIWTLSDYFKRVLHIRFIDLQFIELKDKFYLSSPMPYPKKLKNKSYILAVNLSKGAIEEEIAGENPNYKIINTLARGIIDNYLNIKVNIAEFYSNIEKIDVRNGDEVRECAGKLRKNIRAYGYES